MRRHLLDVNVLVALAWPNHVHHRAAQTWFGRETRQWATTAMSECGFVRICSNPRAVPTAVSPRDAILMLSQMRSAGDHEFLPDPVGLVVGTAIAPERVTGHQQVTDAHLLAVALAHQAALTTFDRGAAALAPDPDDVVLIPIST